MDCHLVSVKVRIKGRTHQRMKLDGFTLYQNRFKSLNSQTVQCRSTVQHNRMFFDYVFQNVPHLRLKPLYHFLCVFNIMRGSVRYQLLHNEGFEKLDGHLFREAALVNLKLRPYHDNGTSRIIHTFSQKVLTETSRFTFQHVRERFQRTVSGACHRTASSSVVNQGVYRLLKHSLFIADNNVRRTKLQQSLQTVIAVDDPAVEIVQVRGGKTAAVQLNHRPQIRGDHRDHGHYHPLRTVPGFPESFHYFQPLNDSGSLLACRLF